ncbi:hypothetical protein GCM10010123_29250 [Pilimelia anulata]|uniref:Uncharacterized protein n=1 Tax=Pilimelia anulata TaxID=53371 RepID=A0A8J3FBT1_9ACTN|nr:hypothetical protein [Pilimelia anulata]GGJ97376.1 hypothetical protein GCM10010123_29250 [Pilimelia anulata]
MSASDLVHAAWSVGDPREALLALHAAAPPKGVNTEGVVSFFASKIAPILLAILGIIFIGRASRGEISKVLTSSAIAIVGLGFIAGAATMFFVGEYLIGLMFK